METKINTLKNKCDNFGLCLAHLKGRKGTFNTKDGQRGLRTDLKSFVVNAKDLISRMSYQSPLSRELSFTWEGRDTEGVCNRRADAEKKVENSQEWNIRIDSFCVKENVNLPIVYLDRAASSVKVYLDKS